MQKIEMLFLPILNTFINYQMSKTNNVVTLNGAPTLAPDIEFAVRQICDDAMVKTNDLLTQMMEKFSMQNRQIEQLKKDIQTKEKVVSALAMKYKFNLDEANRFLADSSGNNVINNKLCNKVRSERGRWLLSEGYISYDEES